MGGGSEVGRDIGLLRGDLHHLIGPVIGTLHLAEASPDAHALDAGQLAHTIDRLRLAVALADEAATGHPADDEHRARHGVGSNHYPALAEVGGAAERGDERDIGPHDLVIAYGDCEFYGSCSCGQALGLPTKPNESLDVLGQRWERHVMAEHRDCGCEPCSW